MLRGQISGVGLSRNAGWRVSTGFSIPITRNTDFAWYRLANPAFECCSIGPEQSQCTVHCIGRTPGCHVCRCGGWAAAKYGWGVRLDMGSAILLGLWSLPLDTHDRLSE